MVYFMVYNGKSQSKMDENWGYTHDLGKLQMLLPQIQRSGASRFGSEVAVDRIRLRLGLGLRLLPWFTTGPLCKTIGKP